MISYKTPQADLESKKGLYFEVGMVLSLLAIFVVFQIKTPVRSLDSTFRNADLNLIEEEMLNTEQAPPPPPVELKPQNFSLLKIVEDESLEAENVDIQAEVSQKTVIPEYVPLPKAMQAEEEIVEAQIFTIVEQQPSFPGGDIERIRYFNETIKYPTMAREVGIMGTVYIGFVVEPDGSISNVKVLRGIGGGCDEEAIRVVSAMPRWVPGKQLNKPVRVRFNMPVRFTLL